jgi:hypothetical protein
VLDHIPFIPAQVPDLIGDKRESRSQTIDCSIVLHWVPVFAGTNGIDRNLC